MSAAPRFLQRLRHSGARNQALLSNAGSMIAALGTSSLLGAAFWWLAAREFPQHAVGVAGAAVSAMTLLGFTATIGLGTVLMGELPRRPGHSHALLNAALLAAGLAGAFLGLLFAVVAPLISSGFDPLRATGLAVAVFAAGVGLTALTLVLDQALIGLLKGGLQLLRNAVFAGIKLVLLIEVAALGAVHGGMGIYAAWALGSLLSLAVLWRFYGRGRGALRPNFAALNAMRLDAASHHAFNLALRAPDLLLPVMVLVVLSADLSASFYIAWMIASLLFSIPQSLSTVLYAVGSGDPGNSGEQFRFSLRLSAVAGVIAVVLLFAGGEQLLSLFGETYADQATLAVQILALGLFPESVRTHFVAVRRLSRRIGSALPLVWGGAALEVAGGTAGALLFDDLTGVAVGWLVAICIESAVMSRDVRAALRDAPIGAENQGGPGDPAAGAHAGERPFSA